jgi:hypothetical protein
MQLLMARSRNLSHLLRVWRESCHTAQGLVSNGSDVFGAVMSGLYLAWVSKYDSEFRPFMISGSGGYFNLIPAKLVLLNQVPMLDNMVFLLFQTFVLTLISPLGNLVSNLCSPSSRGTSLLSPQPRVLIYTSLSTLCCHCISPLGALFRVFYELAASNLGA